MRGRRPAALAALQGAPTAPGSEGIEKKFSNQKRTPVEQKYRATAPDGLALVQICRQQRRIAGKTSNLEGAALKTGTAEENTAKRPVLQVA